MNTSEMTREQWLAERKSGIGGSEAAAILGLSPWATPVTVWLDKTGRRADEPPTEAMMLGTELEDFVARRYEAQTGRRVRRYNRMIHKGCLLGNFDRLVVPDGEKVASHMGEIRTDLLLECKTASRAWEDGVPLYYQTQVQHYMGLAPEIKHADVAVLFLAPAKKFEIHRVERDDATIEVMRERLTAWWERYVLGDEMPPPTNEEDCRLLWARSNPGKTVVADDDIANKLNLLKQAKEDEKTAKSVVREMQESICAYLGDAEILAGADGRPLATWKSAKDSVKTNWEAVAREMGATDAVIAHNTATVAGSRRFIVK